MTAVATDTFTVAQYIAKHRPDYNKAAADRTAYLINEAIAGDPQGDLSVGTDEQGEKVYAESYLTLAVSVAVAVAGQRMVGVDIPSPEGFEG